MSISIVYRGSLNNNACYNYTYVRIHIEDTLYVFPAMHALQIMVSSLTAKGGFLSALQAAVSEYVFVPTALDCSSILKRIEEEI